MSTAPVRISWTSLRGKLERKGSRTRTGKGYSAIFYPGNVVDSCVREWVRDPSESLVGMVGHQMTKHDEFLRKQGKMPRWSAYERDSITEKCERALKAIQPFLEERVLPYDFTYGYRFETDIMESETGVPFYLVGELDLLVRVGDVYRVHDVKMTDNPAYWRHTLGQLWFYAAALGSLDMPVVEASLIQPLCTQMELTADLSAKSINSITRAISDYLR